MGNPICRGCPHSEIADAGGHFHQMFFRVGFLFGDWPFDWILHRFLLTLLCQAWSAVTPNDNDDLRLDVLGSGVQISKLAHKACFTLITSHRPILQFEHPTPSLPTKAKQWAITNRFNLEATHVEAKLYHLPSRQLSRRQSTRRIWTKWKPFMQES